MEDTFYSNGKLLLTGEYVVLDGATALAIPTKKGQSLTVLPRAEGELLWNSYDEKNRCWFSAGFSMVDFSVLVADRLDTAITLSNILRETRHLNPKFLSNSKGVHVITELDFPRNWGLGTSSTLINNIAQWAQVDAFTLLKNAFGGSGYDIAAAQHNTPVFYTVEKNAPKVQEISLPWDFTDSLFFVHLNKKQDSKQGIAKYGKKPASKEQIERISDLSKKLLLCYTLSDFEALMAAHERIISEIIQMPTAKERLFADFSGTVKSLGAWGGDFVLATGSFEEMSYFKEQGYGTIVPFHEMVK
ncbi:GYDIA family GHMP kinase [Marinirhabdus gelatinilytica]|uniref:Mevalonate kinase n=1 Tax=Marinirhabdus gelatinilytica TaxID=1703343 RepID=A0A370QL58_9FLAO|nr:GYDIA family GHMP kinase [Marinirhabdus gelatinilytica]RDK89079.1 mevalonate kinase [Marinirhabdus gelatinilytica]